MKCRKTGGPMPLYVVKVLFRATKLEEQYNINELCYIRITIERYKCTNIVKFIVAKISVILQTFAVSRPNTRNVQVSTLFQIVSKLVKLHLKTPIAPVRTRLHTAVALRTHNFIKSNLFLKTLNQKEKPKAFTNMMAQIMSHYNYVRQFEFTIKASKNAPKLDPSAIPNIENANPSQNNQFYLEAAATENSHN